MKKVVFILVGLISFQFSKAQNHIAVSGTSTSGAIYHTGGNLGIGTTSPLTDLQIDDRLHLSGGVNGVISNNAWHNGTQYVRTVTGAAAQFAMTNNGSIFIRNAASATAGSPVSWNNAIYIGEDGKVGIGTVSETDMNNAPDYQLYVQTGIITEKVKVALKGDWADYVFDKDYSLMNLDLLEKYIDEHHHLPDLPSADEVKENGIDLGEMDAKLLQKIEELTLYVIDLKKENEELKSLIQQQ